MRENLRFLVVEDNDSFRETVRSVLGVYNEMDMAVDLKSARELLQKNTYDVVIIDKGLSDGNGADLIPEIKADTPNTAIVILTADDNYNEIQKCLGAGAVDYIVKSKSIIADLLIRIHMAISHIASERHCSQLEAQIKESLRYEIMGGSEHLRDLRSTIKGLKWSRSHILITGESGTGKELIARRIHAMEDNHKRPFVIINCGGVAKDLFESELFGHKKGSFTGANTDKIGKFELANGGDIFLDEIGELPLSMQPTLLRVLQDGCFSRVGCNKVIHSSFRVIAATNRNIEKEVAENKFREDLYYRLNVVRITTPTLRSCKNDIPNLAQFFLLQLGGFRLNIAPEGLEYLKNHTWPGNFRELRNCIERAKMSAETRNSKTIEPEDFTLTPIPRRRGRHFEIALPEKRSEISSDGLNRLLEEVEAEYLRCALELCDGKALDIANILNLSRSTAFRKLNQHGLTRRSRTEQDGIATNA
jgi:DNA-binding NtrC family response regulator